MKRTILHTIAFIFLFVSSCQKEPFIRFGFDTEFEKNSQGLVIMNVDKNSKSITLTGEIIVVEGEILVELIDPTGENAFIGHLVSPLNQQVNESFDAIPGNWKLKYKSIEGEGSINLHLNE